MYYLQQLDTIATERLFSQEQNTISKQHVITKLTPNAY